VPGCERRASRGSAVVVRADQEADRPIDRRDYLSGDEDDRELLAELVPQVVADLVAVDLREGGVEEHERRPLCLDHARSPAQVLRGFRTPGGQRS